MAEKKQDTLLTLQASLQVPKNQHNDFGGYSYRSAEDILNALKPLLKTFNSILTLKDEPVFIGDWHYIKAMAELKTPEQTYTVTAYAREAANKKGMDESQITGTASSYARKYALNGLFLIDDTKDADTEEYHKQNQNTRHQDRNNYQRKQANSTYTKKPATNAKKQAFLAFVKQIAKLLKTDEKDIQKEVIQKAQEKIDWDKSNDSQRATASLQIAEAMRDELLKK